MGLEQITIFLNNKNVFYAGEMLSGFCQVVCSEMTQIPCLKIRLEGYARVHWSETRTRTHTDSHGHSHSETYTVHFSSAVDLICLEQDVLVQGGMLPPGNHSLPFGFQLPPNLVTSFEGAYGYIRYWLEAKVPQNWFKALFAPKGSASIKVLQPLDTNIPQYAFPVGGVDSKEICCCCCAQGPLVVRASTDRAAYCPNEIVCISANFDNKSRRQVKPFAKLVQRVTFFAQGHSRQSTNSWNLGPVSAADGLFNTILENGNAQWPGINFAIPHVSPSITMPIIQVSYYIEIGLDIPMAFDLEVYLPIVIGTIPFRGQPTVVTGQIMPSNQPPPYGAAQAYQSATPWQGTGHQQSGGPPASAPPLEYGIVQNAKMSEPPPSYFDSVFVGQQAALPADDHVTSRGGQGGGEGSGAAGPPIGFKQ